MTTRSLVQNSVLSIDGSTSQQSSFRNAEQFCRADNDHPHVDLPETMESLIEKRSSRQNLDPCSVKPRTFVSKRSRDNRQNVQQERGVAKRTKPWPSTLAACRLQRSTAVGRPETLYLDLLERLRNAMSTDYEPRTAVFAPAAASADTLTCQAQIPSGPTAYGMDIAEMNSAGWQAHHSFTSTSSFVIPAKCNDEANSALSAHHADSRSFGAGQFGNLYYPPAESSQLVCSSDRLPFDLDMDWFSVNSNPFDLEPAGNLTHWSD